MDNPADSGNQLGAESSPYLIQHAANPVHWRAWKPEALAEAKAANKPILLSIGYAACHWCHVMAHESFENPAIAELMNALFVNIKVDREERPDIDQIYMAALHAMGEQGGWPLTMFLDPDGNPFWGGTYFPPEQRYGRPGFPQILRAIDHAWQHDRDRLAKSATALNAHLQQENATGPGGTLPGSGEFADFAQSLLALHDPDNGGIRGNPKFPNAPLTECWLRAARSDPQSPHAQAFLKTIRQISNGGIYDHLAGGLSRYSVDALWLVPHFEKMLYDNAHYLRALKSAWQLDADPLFRNRINETIEWLVSEMRLPGGAFASSLDADTEGGEGLYYIWPEAQIDQLLGPGSPRFKQAYGVTAQGNFEHANILNRLVNIPLDPQTETILQANRKTLLAARSLRVRPGLDDKTLTDWNGYVIRALAECAFVLKRQDWMELAKAAYRSIARSADPNGHLPHSSRNGVEVRPAMATDYAAMANAALTLFETTGDPVCLADAQRWEMILSSHYGDEAGGYYLTAASAQALITRPRCASDEANPSGASQILEALVRLAGAAGDPACIEKAWGLCATLHGQLGPARHGTAGYWNGVHSLQNQRHILIEAPDRNAAESFLDCIRQCPDPALTFHVATAGTGLQFMGAQLSPPSAITRAILCTQQACSQPVTDPQQLRELLKQSS